MQGGDSGASGRVIFQAKGIVHGTERPAALPGDAAFSAAAQHFRPGNAWPTVRLWLRERPARMENLLRRRRVRPAAWPALREELEDHSPEVRKRVGGLLAKPRFNSPERLRILSAIEALERIGTPAAKALLEKLLAAKPAADWKEEIEATLARLASRGR